MIVLSHRGYWKTPEEKNQPVAFERSFALGYGTETDIRDHNRNLVISHDMASATDLSLEDMLHIYRTHGRSAEKRLPLALNIKADGTCY